MFGWEFPPFTSGGLGVACYGLSRALSKKADITFVLPRLHTVRQNGARIIFAGIKTYEIDSTLSSYATPESYGSLPENLREGLYGRGLFEEVARYAVKARGIAECETFDVIHAHDWLSFPAGLEARRISGKPLVVHIHATEYDRTGGMSLNRKVYEIERLGMQEADAVIAVSSMTKDILINQYGIAPEKIHVIHNGIDLEDFSEPETTAQKFLALKEAGNNIVIFVGRITLQKGPDYFVRAAQKVLAYVPNTYFVIAGSGDMERQIIREAAERRLGGNILFAGFLEDAELARLYRAADLFVLPSVSEPFGIAPLESIAHGTPVLISKQTGVGEIIKNALKTDFWDVDEIANKIVAVLRHRSLRNHLAQTSKEELIGVSWLKAADACLAVYRHILGALKST